MKSQDRRVVSEMIGQEIAKLNLTTTPTQEPDKTDPKADNILKFVPLLISLVSLGLSLFTCNLNKSQWSALNDANYSFNNIELSERYELDEDSFHKINFSITPIYTIDPAKRKAIFYYNITQFKENWEPYFYPSSSITMDEFYKQKKQRNYPDNLPAYKYVAFRASIHNVGKTAAKNMTITAYLDLGGGWILIPEKWNESKTGDIESSYNFDGHIRIPPEQAFYDSIKIQVKLDYETQSGDTKTQTLAGAFVTKFMQFSRIPIQKIIIKGK